MCVCYSLSCVQPFATTWTLACQAPLSMELTRQEYWSGLPFSSPGCKFLIRLIGLLCFKMTNVVDIGFVAPLLFGKEIQ